MTLLLTVTLAGAAAHAQQGQAPQKPSGGTFQICLFPNPCGPNAPQPQQPPAPKPDKAEPAKAGVEAIPADPLTQAVVDGSVASGEGGIVSSIRLSPAQTGVGREQIITHGTALRDALAPVRRNSKLPSSVVPARKDAAKSAAEDEWVEVDSKSAAAGQLNGMRAERKALQGGAEQATGAGRRMYKDAK